MNQKSRIDLTKTKMDTIMAFVGGNPGAVSALVTLMQTAKKVDPDSIWEDFTPLMALDNLGIYEEKIWMLYKDVCGQSALNCHILFRAQQMGHLTESEIIDAVNASNPRFDFVDLLHTIQMELPHFGGHYEA